MAKHSLLDVAHVQGKALPRRIIYPKDFFPLPDPGHQELMESFIRRLETHLDVQRVQVSLAQLWEEQPPSDSLAAGQPLQDYMKKVTRFPSSSSDLPRRLTGPEAPFWSLYYDHYHASDRFRSDYRDRFGREPFVEASSRFRWYGSHSSFQRPHITYLPARLISSTGTLAQMSQKRSMTCTWTSSTPSGPGSIQPSCL